MNKKIDELLAVLDLPEQKQWFWCVANVEGFHIRGDTTFLNCEPCPSLADLAFRLRDEVVLQNKGVRNPNDLWVVARIKVCTKKGWCLYDWNSISQPIHWIIAALVARELKND